MKNEKRYEALVNMIRAFDAASDNGMGEELIKNPRNFESLNAALGAVGAFYGWAAYMLIDALEGMDKETQGAGKATAIKRIYKSAAKSCNVTIHGAFKSGERWAICDSYRFVRLNNKPESIPECEGFDLGKCIPEQAKYAEVVKLPSVVEIKKHIANMKAQYGKTWHDHHGEVMEALPDWWCNAEYLLDMVQALPNGTAHKPESPHSPLYYESEDGDALLLPVRHSAA